MSYKKSNKAIELRGFKEGFKLGFDMGMRWQYLYTQNTQTSLKTAKNTRYERFNHKLESKQPTKKR